MSSNLWSIQLKMLLEELVVKEDRICVQLTPNVKLAFLHFGGTIPKLTLVEQLKKLNGHPQM